MHLSVVIPIVVALACPIGMGLMMWMLHRNMGGQNSGANPSQRVEATADRLLRLRAERVQLEQAIAEAERAAAFAAGQNSATPVSS